MKSLKHLFDRNISWAESIKEENPDFFSELSQEQEPDYLWIGCSDSRVPESQIVDLPPGEIFVHRNIANLVIEDDENCLSVLQFAVEALNIDHIIICGHYGCGGVKAALENNTRGYINDWLTNIRSTITNNKNRLKDLEFDQKHDLLCDLKVGRQVKNVCNTDIVQQAWAKGTSLSVHGWIYSLQNGILKELQAGVSSPEELESLS